MPIRFPVFTKEELERFEREFETEAQPIRRIGALVQPFYGTGIVDDLFRDVRGGSELVYSQNYQRAFINRIWQYEGINPCAEMILPIEMQYDEVDLRLDGIFKNAENLQLGKYKGGTTMENSKFNKEDEITIVKSKYEVLIGKIGLIKDIIIDNKETRYGIEFNEDLLLHDMNGKTKKGHGWYVLESEIDVLNKSKLCRMIVKDEDLLKAVKTNTIEHYKIRSNGVLTFLTQNDEKLFVFNKSTSKVLALKCNNELDKQVILHVMESMRFLPGVTLDKDYKWASFTQEESDKLEEKMFHEVTQSVEEIIQKKEPKLPVVDKAKEQHFETEEELYALLGITKKD